MRFSKFKGTIYVKNGYTDSKTSQIIIKADGKTIYTSPEINKTSYPIDIDVDITGCNDFQIINTNKMYAINIGNGGFYQ